MTRRKLKRMRSFTLIEVLIVTIIIAILAALILPRLFSQPERANIAEAQQMIGAIKRAQRAYMDLTTSDVPLWLDSTNPFDTNWATLGLVMPPEIVNGGKWRYVAEDTGFVYADRNANWQDRISAYIPGMAPPEWPYGNGFHCEGIYAHLEPADPTKGCTVVDLIIP